MSSSVCRGAFIGILGRGRVSAHTPSRGSFKDYCRCGKEPINLRLPNGIQLSFKASEIFWSMISFCLLISPSGHIVNFVFAQLEKRDDSEFFFLKQF